MSVRVIVVSLLAAGCYPAGEGSTGDQPDAGVGEEPALTRLQATLAGKVLAVGVEEAARRFGPVAPASADASCTTISGDTADADGDAIPADAKLTIDCGEQRLGYSGSLTGVESVTDDQPDAAAWAFSAAVDLEATLATPLGATMLVDGEGSVVASQGSALGPYNLDTSLDVLSTITNRRGVETRIGEAIDWTVSYGPDLEWSAGVPAVVGKLTTEGTWDFSVNGISASASLATPVPLTFRPACKSRIAAGTIEASFEMAGKNATIRVEWTACGSRLVSYDLDGITGEI